MSSKKTKDKNLVEKVNKLKERQNQWMKERGDNKNQKKIVHSSLRSTGSSVKSKGSSLQDEKKSEAMVWTTSSSRYNGFVVRNGSGTSRSRPESACTPSGKKAKTFTHSSLKKQTSSKPLSAESSNFVHSNNKQADKGELDHDEEEQNVTLESDESLSTSFTENMANLHFDKYDSTKYNNNKEGKDKEGIKYMDNHFCASCKQVMVTEDRKPVMVFPCGHSFCAKCLTGKHNCLQCGCNIISIQTNDSLFMIIQQFKRKTEKEELELKEKQIRSYLDEFKNLNTRISIMRGEATDVIDQMEEATHHLIDKQNTIKHHEEYVQELESEIAKLRRAIQSEHESIEKEQQHIKLLERDYDEQKGQLNMLQKTIGSISENKEKLRQMVGQVAPHVIPILEEMDEDQ